MDDHPGIKWNKQLEKIISDEGERALCYSWLHDKSEKRYKNFYNYITLPTIVISTLAGTASIGSATIFGDTPYANIGIGLMSLTVGVLNTVSTHFSWAQRAEGHRVANSAYSKMHRFIMIELSLPRDQRIEVKTMLKIVRDDLDQLLDISPKIPDHIIKDFKDQFDGKTDELSKPGITNGLDPIYVYAEGSSPDPSIPGFASRKPSIQVSEMSSVISRITKAQVAPSLIVPVQTQGLNQSGQATPIKLPGQAEEDEQIV